MQDEGSWATSLGCARELGHDVVSWGIVWRCFFFSLAFTNKKTLILFFLLRLAHESLLFPRGDLVLGCRRMEEALFAGVQGLSSSFAPLPPRLAAAKGAVCTNAQSPSLGEHGTGDKREQWPPELVLQCVESHPCPMRTIIKWES